MDEVAPDVIAVPKFVEQPHHQWMEGAFRRLGPLRRQHREHAGQECRPVVWVGVRPREEDVFRHVEDRRLFLSANEKLSPSTCSTRQAIARCLTMVWPNGGQTMGANLESMTG